MTDVSVELHYGGAWHTVPAYARDPVVVTVGRGGESTDTPPMSASFTIDNRTGDYNPRNPAGVLYGAAGRNTPCRITIDTDTVYELEVSKWTPGRSVESVSGTRGDAWMKVTASGIRRRLGQGRAPLKSCHSRHLDSIALAHWPFDEGAGSLVWTDTVGGLTILPSDYSRGQITSGQQDMAPWLEKALHMDTGAFITSDKFDPPIAQGTGGLFGLTWVTRRNDTDQSWKVVFVTADGTDTLASVTVFGSLNEVDVNILSNTTALGSLPQVNVDGPICWHLLLGNSGSDITWALYQLPNTTATISGTRTGKSVTDIGYIQVQGGVNISHLAVIDSWDTIADQYAGNVGESAEDRFTRLCSEEGITSSTVSPVSLATSQSMGPQYPGAILDQFKELEETDNAIIVDSLTGRGVTMHCGGSFYNESATLTIDYSLYQLAPTTEPVLDDVNVRNDIIVKRRDGGQYEATQETGPNNTQDPTVDDQGIGRVLDQPTVNCSSDSLLTNIAHWRLHIGTVDEMRWPTVTVDYVATPSLAIAAVGERISITNVPEEISPGPVDLLVVGYTDEATPGTRRIAYATVPFSSYNVFEVESGPDNTSRLAATSTLAASYTSSDTSLSVTSTGTRWVDSATYASDFPMVIAIEGERMTCTAITGTGLTQTFTVTRGLDGFSKALTSGSAVQIDRPGALAL